ncbi:MAG: MBL fold metallo-hydrolase [Anaerolineales bacterium]|nr:MBL fold metallo-hydrolase [Anaerolineales bacterium]
MQWHVIRTGRVWVDPGGPFGLVPRPLWEKYQTPDEHGRVPMDLNCLLVFSDDKIILIDNGLGDKLDERARQNWGLEYPHGTLLENLAKHGIQAEEVDIMIDTHLHSDHCSGNTRLTDGETQPTFPNAQYIVQRLEWADAMHPNVRTRNTYLPENFVPVWEKGLFRFLRGDTQITSHVRCVLTRGHTRGHQCVLIEGAESPILFMADLASYAVNMTRQAWVTAYDVEPLETIATKSIWQAWALEHDALLIFQHDTTMTAGKLYKDDKGRLQLRPVEV